MDSARTPEVGTPALVLANWYRFSGGERIRQDFVASIGFIWCVSGRGTVSSGMRTFPMNASDLVRLPWRHDVRYAADATEPFIVGSVHLLPWHRQNTPIEARAAHNSTDPLVSSADRTPPRDWVGEFTLDYFKAPESFIRLASWATELFVSSNYTDSDLRALGVLLAHESARLDHSDLRHGIPAALAEMQAYISANLSRPLPVKEISRAGGCSIATAQRLFLRHTQTSIQVWVRHRRMGIAAELLRTTSLRVSEVATLVGYADSLYFSRVFKSTFSVAPSRYAAGALRL